MIDPFLKTKLSEIREACNTNNVVRLYVFGSVVDGRFKEGKSDIDMLVEFDSNQHSKKENSRNLLKLWMELQAILGAKVDLITTENIQGAYFKKYLDLYKEKIFERNTEVDHRQTNSQ